MQSIPLYNSNSLYLSWFLSMSCSLTLKRGGFYTKEYTVLSYLFKMGLSTEHIKFAPKSTKTLHDVCQSCVFIKPNVVLDIISNTSCGCILEDKHSNNLKKLLYKVKRWNWRILFLFRVWNAQRFPAFWNDYLLSSSKTS